MGDSPTLLFVVGARPNFVKVAPVVHAVAGRDDLDAQLLHTGQHYDRALSEAFIEQLGIPAPDHHLGVGSGTHAAQAAAVLAGVERVLDDERPDALIVAGDVNSTLGAALAGAQARVPVVHVESGLRSRDRTMPEELNRVLTDHAASLLLCHSDEAIENLAAEGIAGDSVQMVGNTMIDSLFRLLPAAAATGAVERLGLSPRGYVLVTLHRPALVDDPERLGAVFGALGTIAERLPVVVPLHPRTQARLDAAGLGLPAGVTALEPLEYLEFIALEASARLVVTDSGGLQEETSALGVPCLTYRTTTERPVTCRLGTNTLIGLDPGALASAAGEELDGTPEYDPAAIPLWDGAAGPRAAEAIAALLERHTAVASTPAPR